MTPLRYLALVTYLAVSLLLFSHFLKMTLDPNERRTFTLVEIVVNMVLGCGMIIYSIYMLSLVIPAALQ
jgi:hypothetical protein